MLFVFHFCCGVLFMLLKSLVLILFHFLRFLCILWCGFSTAIGIFVGIETTLWFSCNVDKLFSFNQFYRHCISILGSDVLYNIPGLKCVGFYINDTKHENYILCCYCGIWFTYHLRQCSDLIIRTCLKE